MEMLSVIGVIGVISAIAIPNISRIRESAETATAQRNAQNLASVFISARAAGVDLLAEGNLEKTVSNIVAGDVAAEGVFEGSYFGIPGLSEDEQTAALGFLALQGQELFYQSSASSTAAREGGSDEKNGGSDLGIHGLFTQPIFVDFQLPPQPDEQLGGFMHASQTNAPREIER